MKKYFPFLFLFIWLFGFSFISSAQFYTGSQLEFGKNRIQYDEPRYWTFYSYDRYSVYFYEGGKEIANYVSKSAKTNLEQIEKMLDSPIEKKLQFIIYNKQSDYAQSNLGYSTDEQYNIGGVTKIVGTKIILYFEGDHQKLEQQIRAGIAEVALNEMMYGGGVGAMVRNSALLVLPDWYTKGLIAYISTYWNTDMDNWLRDGIMSGKYKKFNRLTGIDATYAGHSIWNYIAETYGESVIPNLLYMTKVSRSMESAFMFVLGTSTKSLTNDWYSFYQSRYESSEKNPLPEQTPILKKPRSTRVYNQVKISPDGKKAIYVTNEMGQYKVWLYDFDRNKAKRILKFGQKLDRINDYSYPLLAWHPSGQLFSIIREHKGKLLLMQYDIEDRKKQERRIINFEKVLDFSYSSDGKKFAMSAVQNGQSDIFVFTAASNGYEQITKDIYDDLNPRFVHNSKEIVFSSNRNNDTIKLGNDKDDFIPQRAKDIFVYDYASRSNVLKRVTNTPYINESNPADYDSLHISYLSDQNGIKNRYLAHFDSTISFIDTATHYRTIVTSFPITNYSRNIIEQDINVKSNKYAEVIYSKGKYRMYTNDLTNVSSLPKVDLENTTYRANQVKEQQQKSLKAQSEAKAKENVVLPKTVESPKRDEHKENLSLKPDSNEIDINNYIFDNEEKKSAERKESVAEKQTPSASTDTSGFKLAQQRNYHINYAVDYVVTQFDNTFLNSTYQKFTGGSNPIYLTPGLSELLKVGMSDLFEDYRIIGAMNIPFSLSDFEYYLSYEDRKKRLDKQYILHRQSFSDASPKTITNDGKYILKWPFTEITSVRGTLMLRNDETIYPSVDDVTLKQPNLYTTTGGAKIEFIYDNTRNTGLNLYNGVRAKIFGEYYQQVYQQNTDMYIVGIDVRYYQKIHRGIIWANRFAASTSFGHEKLVYYMGGVDNWLVPKFDNSINVATDQNYAYQTIATPMRGFYQNIRNGNSFALINSELRVPIFKYFANKPLKSDFFNNFQVIGFTDIGTAWTGDSPYSQQNYLKQTVISNPGNPLLITLNNNSNPIVAGYGWGIRSRILGYFVKLDWAWGVEDLTILPRMTYLSLGLDF